MSRGEDPQTGNKGSTAEERAIDVKSGLPGELTTGCGVAIGNAQVITILIDVPS
jgi:hypothetical protein